MKPLFAFIGAFFSSLAGAGASAPASSRVLQRSATPRQFRRAFLYRGVFARVARELGVSISHVRRVALRERISAEVAAALTREIERIEEAA